MNRVLNFHKVTNRNWFDSMICFLQSKYKMISADSLYEFYNGNTTIQNSCHITVDDGDKTFYEIIFPVLKKYKVACSLYVSPKICKEESNFWYQQIEHFNFAELKIIIAEALSIPLNSLLNYRVQSILKTMPIEQIQEIIKIYKRKNHTPKLAFQNITIANLKEIDQSGLVTIGGHTMNHPILNNETDINSKYEIEQSVFELAGILNHEINYFAYPNGIPMLDFSAREVTLLKNMGIKLAFTTASKNLNPSQNTMQIPRFGVSNLETLQFLKLKLLLGSSWDSLKNLQRSSEFKERDQLKQLIFKETISM